MRDAKAQDYWNSAYKRKYTDNIVELDFKGLNNLPILAFPNGLLALCGLNGAGKSTVVSAIKDVIGFSLSEQDIHRVKDNSIECKALAAGQEINCINENGKRLIDKGWDADKLAYIDSTESIAIQNYIIKQTNLAELLEQFEEYEIPSSDIEEINCLVGKRYTACSFRELEGVNGEDSIVPFFSVEIDGENYDTNSMGYGEHFLLYLYWRINQVDKDTLLIIEEPETYVSISSQVHFANYLGKQMAKKGVKVILTTHSPYILENIRNDNIRIISRIGNSVSIITPDESLSATSILGIERSNIGIFFVEDKLASDYLSIILHDRCPQLLKEFAIEDVGGEAEITKRLVFPYSDNIKYKFIGVYDGDIKTSLDTSKLKWPYCFLPGEKAVEELLIDNIHNHLYRQKLCSALHIEEGRIIAILSRIDGIDHHDWYTKLCELLCIDGKELLQVFYKTLLKDDSEIDKFVTDLYKVV